MGRSFEAKGWCKVSKPAESSSWGSELDKKEVEEWWRQSLTSVEFGSEELVKTRKQTMQS